MWSLAELCTARPKESFNFQPVFSSAYNGLFFSTASLPLNNRLFALSGWAPCHYWREEKGIPCLSRQ